MYLSILTLVLQFFYHAPLTTIPTALLDYLLQKKSNRTLSISEL